MVSGGAMRKARGARKSVSNVGKFILNCKPSRNTERDWLLSAAVATGIHPAAAAAIPASKDLRDDTWWKIGNQGHTGSCVGWGSADGVLRWHFVKAGRLSKTEALSVRFVWMASKETDELTSRPTTFIEEDGTTLKGALDVARRFGVVSASVLPFENAPGKPELFISPVPNDPNPENTFYAFAAQRKIAGYFNLGPGISNWRAWIANNGPILTRLDVDSTWDNASQSWAIRRSASSCATVGIRLGVRKDMPTLRTSMRRPPSPKPTASRCERLKSEAKVGARSSAAPAGSRRNARCRDVAKA
jgi:hypothetical protein